MAEQDDPKVTAIHSGNKMQLVRARDFKLHKNSFDLVKGLIPRNGLVVVWGPPKCGKSFWLFDLMMHVSLGWDYRGRKVHQGTVIYCAFEGQFGLRARMEAYRQAILEDRDPPFFLTLNVLDLIKEHRALINSIRQQLGSQNPSAIVLDTLNKSLAGSENKDEDMSAYIRAADALRESFDCAVIIVHHCGIKGSRPRGHTSLTGALDVQIEVKLNKEREIVAKVELAKDGPTGDAFVSYLEEVTVGTNDDGYPIVSQVIRPAEDENIEISRGLTTQIFDLICKLIREQGQAPKGKLERKVAGQKAICPLEVIKNAFLKSELEGGRTRADNSKRNFRRAITKLQVTGKIKVSDEFVWEAGGADK